MAAMRPSPAWINLEHISAEAWVDGYHAMPSRHPTLPLTKYFFFPGFTANTGGLLFERSLVEARTAFQSDRRARAHFLHALGIQVNEARLTVSLFSYENAALDELVAAWIVSPVPIVCVVPAGRALIALAKVLETRLEPGMHVVHGQLSVYAIPFLDIDSYDRLLWACDVNFVRGEDSFVRAQLAARPLIWQPYVQTDGAHLVKQAAFLDLSLRGVEDQAAGAWRSIHETWNRQLPGMGECWRAFINVQPAAAAHSTTWAAHIVAGGNLATKLAGFCQDRLE
jgi:uncharacterized repeat protein (TIGR03837 family)